MPRRSRKYIPSLPYHIVQRGNNRSICFFHADDYIHYLNLWITLSRKYLVDVHAYCLMTNHIHFLVTPYTETSISDTMKVVGSRYACFINKKYDQTGTLWEGRHRSSLVQSERYLMTCYRYIELNPVRAKMVETPLSYPWSSHSANIIGDFTWLTPHPVYLALGEEKEQRATNYRRLFGSDLAESELKLMRKAAHYCQPVGDEKFKKRMSKKFNIPVGYMQRGRPRLDKK